MSDSTMMSLTKSDLRLVSEPKNLSKEQERKLVVYVNDQFEKAKSERMRAERQWYLNLAFYFGKQNIVVTDTPGVSRTFRLTTPPVPYYRSRPIINLIRPLMRTEMSKLTAQKPTAFVIPASSEDRDLFAAQAGEQIWDSQYRSKNIHKLFRRAVFWSSMTGNGFIKTYWDEDQEDKFNDVLGDICYENVTPFHMFVPDLKEPEIEDQGLVIHAANKNGELLSQIYGKTLNFERAKGELLEESFTNVMGLENSNAKKTSNVLTLEMWIKPGVSKVIPDGGMVCVAGPHVLAFEEGLPYGHKQFPFTHIRHIETGKFYGDSVINDLIPLQREYNRTRGQIIEAKNRMAKPQLAAEIGAIDPGKVTSEPGQIILYRPGFNPPVPIQLQNLPSYVLEEQVRIKEDMNEISGQHEVSRGQAPAGVTAATAISYLQEQDESKLTYTFDSVEEAYEKVAYQTLCLVKEFWNTKRKVKVTGEDGAFDVMAFEGSDLADNTDIRVEAGSSLPTSRAAKQAFIMDLMKMGFIDPNKGLEVMEIGGINKVFESIQVDIRQAQRENLKMAQITPELLQQSQMEEMQKFIESDYANQLMAQGMLQQNEETGQFIDLTPMTQGMPPQPIIMPLAVPVNTWDDHRIHIETHNKYRKSQAYENLSEEAKDLFEDHVKQHVSAIMVGAQGAGMVPPEAMDLINNPETVKEMDQGMVSGEEMPPGQEEALPGMEQM